MNILTFDYSSLQKWLKREGLGSSRLNDRFGAVVGVALLLALVGGCAGPGNAIQAPQNAASCVSRVEAFRIWLQSPTRPAATWIDAKVRQLEARERAGELVVSSEPLQRVYASCPAALAVFQDLSTVWNADVTRWLEDALPEAIEACACAIDFDDARSAHWFYFVPRDGRVDPTTLPKTKDDPGEP